MKSLELDIQGELESSKIESFLNDNPELTSLNLRMHTVDDLKFITFIANNTKIEKSTSIYRFNTPMNDQIHFSKLKHFGYGGGRNEFPFTCTFGQLETLEVRLIKGNNGGIVVSTKSTI